VAASLGLPPDAERPVVAVLLGSDAVAEISAIVGVIAAGAVALPLDSREPVRHLSRIIDQSRPSTMLAVEHCCRWLADVAPSVMAREIPGDGEPESFAPPLVSPDAPAYICYTSGSTGEPKGIVATHRRTVVHARASADELGQGPADRTRCCTHWPAVPAGRRSGARCSPEDRCCRAASMMRACRDYATGWIRKARRRSSVRRRSTGPSSLRSVQLIGFVP
jgi:acyl-CoA synthetase (AMP-forming)/AMP-acid ligase II